MLQSIVFTSHLHVHVPLHLLPYSNTSLSLSIRSEVHPPATLSRTIDLEVLPPTMAHDQSAIPSSLYNVKACKGLHQRMGLYLGQWHTGEKFPHMGFSS